MLLEPLLPARRVSLKHICNRMYNRGTTVCVVSAGDYSRSQPPGVLRYSGANHANTVCQVKTSCAADPGQGI